MHVETSTIGSPASFISMQLTGQTLWQRAPQAIQVLASKCATPRGFFGFFPSLMNISLG
jgi:hypothetical protein